MSDFFKAVEMGKSHLFKENTIAYLFISFKNIRFFELSTNKGRKHGWKVLIKKKSKLFNILFFTFCADKVYKSSFGVCMSKVEVVFIRILLTINIIFRFF